MKKVLMIIAAFFMISIAATSCNKTGCECYLKADIFHIAPEFSDDNMTKEECKAMEKQLNEQEGMDIYKCRQK